MSNRLCKYLPPRSTSISADLWASSAAILQMRRLNLLPRTDLVLALPAIAVRDCVIVEMTFDSPQRLTTVGPGIERTLRSCPPLIENSASTQ